AGVADYRAIFTWRSWALGWMVRVIAQVSFFGLIGLRVADERSAFYLLIGNALAVAAQAGIFSLNMTTTERWAGTLPLLVVNTTYVGFMAACGVNVPLSYYPTAVEWFSHALPLTNGLLAIRGVFAGTAVTSILGHAGIEALVGAAWLTLALLTFNRLASRGRLDGSLDYGA